MDIRENEDAEWVIVHCLERKANYTLVPPLFSYFYFLVGAHAWLNASV
jgi:hypothetical protein